MSVKNTPSAPENLKSLSHFLDFMWKDYCSFNSGAAQIFQALSHLGETVINDHIALRTVNHPKLGIQSLAQHFEKYGYTDCGEYFFKEKKLYAKHYEHPDSTQPKIFISELELEKTSSYVQQTFQSCLASFDEKKINDESFVFCGRPWNALHSVYEKLSAESEYAAWVYAYGFRPNHFTVSINDLKILKSVEQMNQFLEARGFKLNSAGGKIKGTPPELLEQSSTMAEDVRVQFADGVYKIPACYYEFARRYPKLDGQLYQGFIAKSADKIFESTNKSSM
jgi:hypothetical protein